MLVDKNRLKRLWKTPTTATTSATFTITITIANQDHTRAIKNNKKKDAMCAHTHEAHCQQITATDTTRKEHDIDANTKHSTDDMSTTTSNNNKQQAKASATTWYEYD